MNLTKVSVVAVTVATLGASAFGQKPTGNWKGHLDVTIPVKPGATAQEKQMAAKMLESFKKIVIKLSMGDDKKYTLTAEGAPGDTKANKDMGTWSVSGKTVTFKSTKNNPAVTGTISGDGKTLVVTLPGGQGAAAHINFVRA